jgi:hypothetical protein
MLVRSLVWRKRCKPKVELVSNYVYIEALSTSNYSELGKRR